MKFLPLLWSSLWRKKIRTIFTLLSVFVAFVLFGLLMTIRGAFTFGVQIAGVDASRSLYDTGNGMIRLILWISTRRSRPAMSTPKLKAPRIVIRIPNSRNATKTDSSVKMVRIFFRHRLLHSNGRNFMRAPLLPSTGPSRGAACAWRVPRRADRA